METQVLDTRMHRSEFTICNDWDVVPMPDKQVTATEDSITGKTTPFRCQVGPFPPRPGYGSKGQSVILYTNHIQTFIKPCQLFIYRIAISKQFETSLQRKGALLTIMKSLFPKESASIALNREATLIIATKPLHTNSHYLTLTRVEEMHEESALRCFEGDTTQVLDPEVDNNCLRYNGLQIIDVIMSHCIKVASLETQVHRHPQKKSGRLRNCMQLGLGLDAGYSVSVTSFAVSGRVSMRLKARLVPFYRDGLLSTLINEFMCSNTNIKSVDRFIHMLQIWVVWPKKERRTVCGVAWTSDGLAGSNYAYVPFNGAGPFQVCLHTGGTRWPPRKSLTDKMNPTIAAYFKQGTRRKLDPYLPVINIGTRQHPEYVPAELCRVVPTQSTCNSFTSSEARRLLSVESAPVPARGSRETLTNVIETLMIQKSLNPMLQPFGLELGLRPITIHGRILDPPVILARGPNPIQVTNGAWFLQQSQLSMPARIASWGLLYIETSKGERRRMELEDHVQRLGAKLLEMGVVRSRSAPRLVIVDSNVDLQESIYKAVSSMIPAHRITLLVGILPSQNKGAQMAFQKTCDIRLGIQSLHIPREELESSKDSDHFLVGLKANMKLGGRNHRLRPSDLGILANEKTMVVGISSLGRSTASSDSDGMITAVVASINGELTQWPCQVYFHFGRDEGIQSLGNVIADRLTLWMKHNGNSAPEDIVIYWQGLSHSAYQKILKKGLHMIKCAYKRVYPRGSQHPRVAVIIIDSNPVTRIFSTEDTDPYDSLGLAPGTIVDRGVTNPHMWDFFLHVESASARRPAVVRYIVAWDEVFRRHYDSFDAKSITDKLQQLTNNMCYNFGDRNEARSLCPPAYYAQLACSRFRFYLGPDSHSESFLQFGGAKESIRGTHRTVFIKPHPRLRDTMFYL